MSARDGASLCPARVLLYPGRGRVKRSLWPTRDPVKDYFPLPKEIFSLGLSAAEIAIYAYLLFCEDRQTFQC